MNKSDLTYVLIWAKKIICANMLGGKCSRCGNNNIFDLEFHHVDPSQKESKINRMANSRLSLLISEVEKCKLLCKNCHMELHYSTNSFPKLEIMSLVEKKSCENCGYDKCSYALDFHHPEMENKKFTISGTFQNDRFRKDISNVISEAKKCMLLCKNCHGKEHIDIERFNRLSGLIYEKANKYKELKKPMDLKELKLYLEKGMSITEISKKTGYAKSTICGIIKRRISLPDYQFSL